MFGRKFVCPNCGLVFIVVGKHILKKLEVKNYYDCPGCGLIMRTEKESVSVKIGG